jgi:hypothetical protein
MDYVNWAVQYCIDNNIEYTLQRNTQGNLEIVFSNTEDRTTLELQHQWAAIRNERNQLLASTDWTQLNDSPLTEDVKDRYRAYRQALRDMTNTDNIDNVNFPEL